MKKQFYKTTFEITILSEEPITDINIEDLPREYTEGDCVLHSVATKEKILTGRQAAFYLRDAGSEPGFFNLDDNGKAIDNK